METPGGGWRESEELVALKPEQRSDLETRGLVRLPGAVDIDAVAELRARIWELVAEREGQDSTTRSPSVRISAATVKSLKREGRFELIFSPAVRSVADELLGPDQWFYSRPSSTLLMTLPGSETWTVPHKHWHLDYPCPGGVECLPGVQVFLFLDRVEARGGGTVAIAGSHRLGNLCTGRLRL
ncbi:MAG: hypothetical protein GY725_10945 [bacterium]|nr:hypothetical protein [bacterium]